jgi:acyl-CoA synthetase (AMP-forming)/AMP-acid ligase II
VAGPRIYRSRYPDPVVPFQDLGRFTLAHATVDPERTALVDGARGTTWTYGQLLAGVARARALLAELGVGQGARVALAAANQPGWVVAFYAVLAAGGTVVPLNPRLTPGELCQLLGVARPSAVVADPVATPAVLEAIAVAAAPRPSPVPAPMLVPLEELVPESDGPVNSSAGAVASGLHAPPEWRDPGAVAVVAFSSGTTGRVKGVQLTHANLVAAMVQHDGIYHVGPDDVVLAAMPFFHIYGMSIVLGYALRHGATVVTMPRFELDTYCRLVHQHGVTWLHLVPPMVLGLTRRQGLDDFSSVRHAVSGAAPLDATLASQAGALFGCPVGQGYGMTEASPGVTWVPDDGSVPCPLGSVGLLVPGTEARLVDPVTGQDAPGAGELWIRGPQVMAGYLDDPAATAEVVVEGGWLRTGDVMRVDANGVWWVVDRIKELIKVKGWQVAPAELEAVLLEHPRVADAAVAGVADVEAGEVPVAWVVTSQPVHAAELLAWVAGRVASYKRVRRIHVVEAIPRSPSGKVLRRTLVEPSGLAD